jgi:hypothetical protein
MPLSALIGALFEMDVRGSLAYAEALQQAGVLTDGEAEKIKPGIAVRITSGPISTTGSPGGKRLNPLPQQSRDDGNEKKLIADLFAARV